MPFGSVDGLFSRPRTWKISFAVKVKGISWESVRPLYRVLLIVVRVVGFVAGMGTDCKDLSWGWVVSVA